MRKVESSNIKYSSSYLIISIVLLTLQCYLLANYEIYFKNIVSLRIFIILEKYIKISHYLSQNDQKNEEKEFFTCLFSISFETLQNLV